MNAALGAPESMADRSEELTPMLRQYVECCSAYEGCLVLFQVGDFYEAFCEAAETIARLLEITLTKREDSTGSYPMAGIPIDSAESYIQTLLDAGYRVAIADQVQDPAEASGVVDRAVTRIVTPGTLTEDELLGTDDNNFVACLADADGEFGLALLDVSTGECFVTTVDSPAALQDELGRFSPAELITNVGDVEDVDGIDEGEASAPLFDASCMVSPADPGTFELENAAAMVQSYFGQPDAVIGNDAAIQACGALLAYAEYTRGGERGHLDYITRLTRYDPREYMLLDAVARSSLELFERRTAGGDDRATLLGVLDETSCALGRRMLTDWVRRPLLDCDEIESRLDAVEELVSLVRAREAVAELLRDVYDLERLIGRISRGRANARDLRALRSTLAVVPPIQDALSAVESEPLVSLRDDLDELADVRALIDRAIRDDPPIEITDGGLIEPGYSDDLDELRERERAGTDWIDALADEERERTGVDSLKVGYNAVHGYYIEVTKPNLDAVPEEYVRRQTLKNAERFYTPALKRREDEIITARGRANDLEYELFCDVRATVAAETERVQALAAALATLDALVSLATVAATADYARPELVPEGAGIHVERGRHPVVERTQPSFVPNDNRLGGAAPAARKGAATAARKGAATAGRKGAATAAKEEAATAATDEAAAAATDGTDLTESSERANEYADGDPYVAIITGPNMSGKSTYMRQVALIVIMAQVGSFVPAASARLSPVERIFTRIGTSDDIAGGRSTFMVEMEELATILDDATEQSLVLLDEIGRGTSTVDGRAIARAIVEHLHDDLGVMTLFATHHHTLTDLEGALDGVVNLHFSAHQGDDRVRFDHAIELGAATDSYGIEVARTAGVPASVLKRSTELLSAAADDSQPDASGTKYQAPIDPRENGHEVASQTTSSESTARMSIEAELRELDVATTTPLEALTALARLKAHLDE